MIRWSLSEEPSEPDSVLLEWSGPGDLEAGKSAWGSLLLSDAELEGLIVEATAVREARR